MSQHFSFKEVNSSPKLTISNDQHPVATSSCTLVENELIDTNVKKVMSLDCCKMEPKYKQKYSTNYQKLHKVKNIRYTNMQNNFIIASTNLLKSYEEVKKLQMYSTPDKNNLELENLHIIVMNIIEKIFGVKFPKSDVSDILVKQDHQVFVSNINLPLKLDINSTSGYPKLDLAIKEIYDDIWNQFLDISETSMKYHFWLKNIIEPNEFCDLYDVREYLLQNNFHKEQTNELFKLNNFFNSLQLKSIHIINVIHEILDPETKITLEKEEIKSKNENKLSKLETNTADAKCQLTIENHKEEMSIRIKMLEIENENLKIKEADYARQIKSLSKGLEYRNQKLIKNSERLTMLTKEKNDLINAIKKMELKDEGLETLKYKFEKEQDKNKNLRNIIEYEFELRSADINKNIRS